VLDEHQREWVEKVLLANKCKYHTKADSESLLAIRDWDYGVLLLSPDEARGVDTRFRREAHVQILALVKTYHELQQMMGRSSRTRGVCQGSLYLVTEERSGKVFERLKLQGVVSVQGLEKLLLVLEKRAKDSGFVKLMQDLKDN
jgi:hypothetical protein